MAHILVVDDDIQICELIKSMLSGLGHTISTAYNANLALESHREQPADLLISDIVMPGKNGIELIKELKSAAPGMKIIAISGQENNYLNYAEFFGAHFCLKKPFHEEELVNAVKRFV